MKHLVPEDPLQEEEALSHLVGRESLLGEDPLLLGEELSLLHLLGEDPLLLQNENLQLLGEELLLLHLIEDALRLRVGESLVLLNDHRLPCQREDTLLLPQREDPLLPLREDTEEISIYLPLQREDSHLHLPKEQTLLPPLGEHIYRTVQDGHHQIEMDLEDANLITPEEEHK